METQHFTNYSSYDQIFDIKRLKFIETAVNSLERSHLQILEIGCGNGNISYQLAHSGHYVSGIDIDEKSVQSANRKFQHEKLQFRVMDVCEYIVKEEDKYDVIVCSEVLEHLTNPLTIMRNVNRLLKDNGIAVITVPNGTGPRELFMTRPTQYIYQKDNCFSKIFIGMKKCLGYNGDTPQSSSTSLSHIQFFTYKDVHELADKSSFSICKIAPSSFIEKVFPFSIIYRRVRKLQQFDCWMADRLPIRWTSGFYMIMKKKSMAE